MIKTNNKAHPIKTGKVFIIVVLSVNNMHDL